MFCSHYLYSFWVTVCKMVRPMLSDCFCPVLSVCDIGVLWPNSWMNQDATQYGGRPRPKPHCITRGPSSPKGAVSSSPKRSTPNFRPCLLWPNGLMGQDATWYRGRPRPGNIVLDGDPSPPPKKAQQPPYFSAHFHCGQRAGWIKISF